MVDTMIVKCSKRITYGGQKPHNHSERKNRNVESEPSEPGSLLGTDRNCHNVGEHEGGATRGDTGKRSLTRPATLRKCSLPRALLFLLYMVLDNRNNCFDPNYTKKGVTNPSLVSRSQT